MPNLCTGVQTAFPPKSDFSVDDIPDLRGKALLAHGAKVYIAARSAEKSAAAIRDLKVETGKEAHFLRLDLANLKAIKRAVEEFLSKETELHMLFNNGGVMHPAIEQLTADGYDLQVGTNALGHFYFTKLLLPILISTAKQTGIPSRVMTTSSEACQGAISFEYETFKDGPLRLKKGNEFMYSQSKLANLVFAIELTRRYGDKGIVSAGINPGFIKTDLQRTMNRAVHAVFDRMAHPTPMGALTQLWGGTTAHPADINGKDFFPAKSQFSVDDIPDLTGQVALVTGANTGIGKETAKALLAHNATVYIAARNAEKSAEAIRDLMAITGKEARFIQLDLADLKSVKKAASEFLNREKRLDMLFNNGGVMIPPIELLTADGYDLTFGTNVLGHFYLTKLLLPVLLSTAKDSERPARVMTTSSGAAIFASDLNYDTFKDGPARLKKGNQNMYVQSKFGNLVFSTELARRYGDQGIVSAGLNPGNIKTDLQRMMSPLQHFFIDWLLSPLPMGALTQLWGATTANPKAIQGKFLGPWARVGKTHIPATDPAIGKKLWDWLEDQVVDI
ncbi:hypothetical protein ONZ45_g16538 [Pleurotus djamor]|nr:hypothetical protein ONZ45_g16538 [Pleurotus djamor]